MAKNSAILSGAQIAELEAKMAKLQRSTRATVPAMVPVHDILRQKFRWYYNWHLNMWSKAVHSFVLLLYIGLATAFLYSSVFSQATLVMASSKKVWSSESDWNTWTTEKVSTGLRKGSLTLSPTTIIVPVTPTVITPTTPETPETPTTPSTTETPSVDATLPTVPDTTTVTTPPVTPEAPAAPAETPADTTPQVQGVTTNRLAQLTEIPSSTLEAPTTTPADTTTDTTTSAPQSTEVLEYPPVGTAVNTFVPYKDETVKWMGLQVDEILNNQTIVKEFSTDNVLWTTDLANLPNSRTLYVKVTMMTSDKSVTPVLNSLTVNYSRLPLTPVTTLPNEGDTIDSTNPVLNTAPFSDLDNDEHYASEWQVTTSSGKYATAKIATGEDRRNLTSYRLRNLSKGTYYWHVRFEDNTGAWSPWSKEASFTVKEDITPNDISTMRTETTKTFQNANNTMTLESYTGIVHYKENYADPNGQWKDINPDHNIDTPEYVLFDQMPSTVKVYKDKVGYEIESRKTGKKIEVVLEEAPGAQTVPAEAVNVTGSLPTDDQSLTGTSATTEDVNQTTPVETPAVPAQSMIDTAKKLAQSVDLVGVADAQEPALSGQNLDFDFEISEYGVRLWKTIQGTNAPRNFKWKVTQGGSGSDLSFREDPEAFKVGDKTEQVTIDTNKTKIDNSSFYWQESAPSSNLVIDTDVTYYPNPDAETTSVDGCNIFQRMTYIVTPWGVMRGALDGNNSNDNATTCQIVGVSPGQGEDGFGHRWLSRSAYLFDSSALPDTATISAATFSIYGSGKGDTLSLTPNVNVYSSTPASNTAITNADFDQYGSTEFSTTITYANWSTSGYNNFTLNASGLAAISKTGVTKLGVRNANYDVANVEPGPGQDASFPVPGDYVSGYFAEQTGTANDPKLVITYTEASPPTAPTIGSPSAQSASSIRWAFTDNASDETGFKVHDGSHNIVATCATANLTYCDETGLSVNTQYTGRHVHAYSANGDSTASADAASTYTLANVPSAPTVDTATTSSLKVTINANSNPAATNVAIYNETLTKYVGADGVADEAAEVWQTVAQWNTTGYVVNTGLTANTSYTYKIKAKNGDNTATALSSGGTLLTLEVGITVSGTVYTAENKSTNVGASKTVAVSLNGAASVKSAETNASGAFTMIVPATTNDILTLYVDNESGVEANLVTQAVDDLTNITGLEMFTDKIVLTHATAGPITNTILATANNSADSNIHYTDDSTSIGFDEAYKVWIPSGKTYTPGGNITSMGGLYNAGTFNPESNTVSFSGDFTNASTINTSTSTFNFVATSGTKTLTSGGTQFKNFAINASGAIIRPSGTLDIAGTFTLQNGTFDLDTNDPTVNLRGNITISGGTLTKGSGTVNLLGDLTYNAPGYNFGIVVVGASPDSTTLASDFTADSLTVAAGDTLYTRGYEVTVGASGITVATGVPGGTIDATDTGGAGYEGDGSIITSAGNFTINSGGVFTKEDDNGRTSLVKLTKAGATNLTSSSQDLGNFQISTGTNNVTLQDALNVDALTIDTSTTLTRNSQTINVAGNWANSGTFTHGDAGTVTFDGAGTQTIDTGGTATGKNFFAVTHSGAGTAQLINNTINIDSDFTNSGGTWDSNNQNMTVAGSWNNSATFTPGSGTVTFDGNAAGKTITAGGASFNNLTFNGQSATTNTDTGFVYAGTAAESYAGSLWTDKTYATGDNASDFAYSAVTSLYHTAHLDLTNFGFSIPEGSTILGVEAVVRKSKGIIPYPGISDENVYILKAGAGTGNNKAVAGEWPTADSPVETTYGGGSDAWGATLSAGDVNASNFGMFIQVQNGNDEMTPPARIYTVKMKVYYSTSAVVAAWSAQDTLRVSGNFTRTAGAFTHNDQEVILNGAAGSTQVITGDTTFYDLTATASTARTINFASGSTTTVEGTWTVTGADGQNITLGRDGGSGTDQWDVNPTLWSIDYVAVSNSHNNAASPIDPDHWSNVTNNLNWTSPITVAGTVYTAESKATNIGASKTVAVSVNGGTKTTAETDANGAFTITTDAGISNNDPVIVFVDDESGVNANLITQGTGSSITGLELYTGKIVLTHESAGPMTNTLLNAANNLADSDIHYTDNASFDTAYELFIQASKTYTPGGTVTTVGDIDINGTLSPESYTVNVAGSWDATGGTFTKGTSTINFNGAGNTPTITSGSQQFYNLTIAGDEGAPSGTVTLRPTGTGTHSVLSHQVVPGAPNYAAIDESVADDADYLYGSVGGAAWEYFTHTAANLPLGAVVSNVTLYGRHKEDNADAFTRLFVYTSTQNAQSLSYRASYTQDTWSMDTKPEGGSWSSSDIDSMEFGVRLGDNEDVGNQAYISQYYAVVSYDIPTGTWTLQDDLSVSNTLNVTTGALASGSASITTKDFTQDGGIITAPGSSDLFTISDTMNRTGGTFNNNSGTVKFTATTAKNITSGGATFKNVTFDGASGVWTMQDALDVNGNLSLTNGTLAAGANAITLAGDWTKTTGTFTANTSTVTLDGAGGSTQTISGSNTFNNLSATATTTRSLAFASETTQTISGTWTATGTAPDQYITLSRSGGADTDQWSINPTAWTVDYVDVTNSLNLASNTINPTNFVVGNDQTAANNTNWFGTTRAIIYYTIEASSGANGSISPSGFVSVKEKDDRTFTITPSIGYAINDVLVDGVSVGAVASYTFTNLSEDHTISVTFKPSIIANPTNFTGIAGDTATDLSWTNPGSVNFTYTTLYRSTQSGVLGDVIADNLTNSASSSPTYHDSSLINGTTYYYTLKAHDSFSNVSSGTDQLALTPTSLIDIIAPTDPTNLRATSIGITYVSVAWEAATDNVGIAGYVLYNTQTGLQVATTVGKVYTFTGLTAETTYSWYVKAYDAAGNLSGPSNTLVVTTKQEPNGACVGPDCECVGPDCEPTCVGPDCEPPDCTGPDCEPICVGEDCKKTEDTSIYLVLANTPAKIAAGKPFPENVKVMAVDGGGNLVKDYTGSIYFTSTDGKAVLTWSKDSSYNFTSRDAGSHEFNGEDFRLYTVGEQKLTVTDDRVSASSTIVVEGALSIIPDVFQKAQDKISGLIQQNGDKVNTAALVTTAALLAPPLLINVLVGLSNIWSQFAYWFIQLLQLLGIRKRRKPWGIVFDSESGQPVKYALVKVYDKEYNRLIETAVADGEGRYGFLVKPGIFYLVVKKGGYTFPSTQKASNFYQEIYNGGDIRIERKDEVITLNVPMDPEVKASVSFRSTVALIKISKFFNMIRLPLLVFGTLLSVVLLISSYSPWYFLSLGFYILIFAWDYIRSFRARPYGVVSDIFGHPLDTVIVRVYEKKTDRLVGTDVTDDIGRFRFLVAPGIYYVKATKPGYADFKSHMMYLEKEKTTVSINVKMKKINK